MAFSQSLDIGNSTLLNLESQARHVIDNELDEEGQQDAYNIRKKEDAAEVIQESPEHGPRSKQYGNTAGLSMFSRSRTQRQLSRNNCSKTSLRIVDVSAKDRRRLRKSKSDSTLKKPNTLNGINKAENYTELFHGGFTFSIEGEQQKNVFEGSGSVLRVSQIEAAFDMIKEEMGEVVEGVDKIPSEDELAVNNVLDMPIFSEDLNDILKNVRIIAEEKDMSYMAPNSSNSLFLSEFGTDNSECKYKTTEIIDEPDARQLDQSRFICVDANSFEAKKQIKRELEISRREVAKADKVLQTITLKKDTNTSYAQRSTSFSNSSVTTVKKAEENIRDLEKLKRINAWNLPHSVLKEYEKKGVVKLFDWQIECLRNPKVRTNLIYNMYIEI